LPARVKTSDLLDEVATIGASLRAIVDGLPGQAPTEMQVWSVYAGTEKVVAILKFRLRAERPGVFSTLPESRVPLDLLPVALAMVNQAADEIRAAKLVEGLESLRGARDRLRAYLTTERKVRMKVKRRAAASRSSS
jgi:hypothetical protein